MNIKKKKVNYSSLLPLLALVLFLTLALNGYGQQKFSTTIYLDYTYYLSNQGPLTSPQGDPNFRNNFFTFRRAYFRYDNKINDRLSFRLTFDGDYVKAVDAQGKKDDKFRPFLKHLYLQVSEILPGSDLKIGMADTITFKLAEDRWGYRSVAKTLLDIYKDVTGKDIDASSADIGVSLTGKIARPLRYGLMLTNGAGYSHPEGDKYKKLMANVQLIPLAGFSLVGYVDYEKQDASNKAVTYKSDVYVEFIPGLTLGAEYFVYRNDKNLQNGERYDRSGLSVFGRYALVPEKLTAFARFDRYEPNNLAANDEISLVIAGIDWAPMNTSFKLQPNIWIYNYKDPLKKNDVVFNMTVFMTF